MIEERREVCERCKGYEANGCWQRCFPISGEEWAELKAAGIKPDDRIDEKGIDVVMSISMKPECKKKALEHHPLTWWANMLRG